MFNVKCRAVLHPVGFTASCLMSLALGLALTLGAPQPAVAELTTGTAQTTSPVQYLPDVTEQMTHASYWSSKQPNPTEVLANRVTIDALNQDGIDADGTMLQPLKDATGNYYGVERQRMLKDAAKSELENDFLGQAYDDDWTFIDQADVDEIVANYPEDGVAPNLASPFAIVTTHTTMRAFPTDKALMYTYGDRDDDNLYMSALRVNEPIIVRSVSTDGRFFQCISSCLNPAWVPVEDVAICLNRDEWLSAWDIPAGKELVVTGYKVRTEQSRVTPNTANRLLYMGTTLERVDAVDASELVGTRSIYDNYVCYLPVRNADGRYSKEKALIAVSEKVSCGFLPLTAQNIAEVAFNSHGQMYGWGGMLEANDCSGYVRDVYKCFGLELARNTTWQMNLPVQSYDLSEFDDAHKAAAIAQMPLGTVLFWANHEMIYLGQENGKLYVISAVGTIGDLFGDSNFSTQVKGVTVSTLDIIRGNRSTWLHNITKANIPYISDDASALDMRDISFYAASVTWPDEYYAYTSEPIVPDVQIPGLVRGDDYEVTLENNTQVGTATVTVTGKGDFTGEMKRQFVIETPEDALARFDVALRGLPSEVTAENVDDVTAAVNAYSSLPDAAKAQISADALAVLVSAQEQVAAIEADRAAQALAAAENEAYNGKQQAAAAQKAADKAAEQAEALRADLAAAQDAASAAKSEANANKQQAEAAQKAADEATEQAAAAQKAADEATGQAAAAQKAADEATGQAAVAQKAADEASTQAQTLQKKLSAARAAVKSDISKATIAVGKVTYTGKAHKPKVKVTLAGKKLTAGKDYSVSYSNNKNAGRGIVLVRGKGSYTGSSAATFVIAKASNTLTAKAKSKKIRVKYAKVKRKSRVVSKAKAFKVSKAKGFVTFAKKSGNKKIVVSKLGAITVKKGLKKGSYKVAVKVKAAGDANYKSGSKVVRLVIRVS